MSVDLHIHTTASDGRLSPDEIVRQAIAVGLTHIAITDHDTIDGLLTLKNNKEMMDSSLSIISGIEFSTDLPQYEVHILGYRLDVNNNTLQSELTRITADRLTRTQRIVKKLKDIGYVIEYERVLELADQATSVGRPHIARALVEKKYFPAVSDVFLNLLRKNGPAYIPHYKLTIQHVIALIKQAGGIPVLAHPGLIGSEGVIQEVIDLGIAGLEVYYPQHNLEQVEKYLELARKYNLIVTGGSDFHGIPGRFPEKLGVFTMPPNSVAAILSQLM